MWTQRWLLLSLAVGILRIHSSCAQLRNHTLLEQGIDELDYFDPEFESSNITRIVGGRPISIRLVPWQAALYDREAFICGASIVSVHWVLTAAHCVFDGGRFTVRAGSSFVNRGGQVRRVGRVIASAAFNMRTLHQDIAMLRVNRRFTLNRSLRPIELARPGRALPVQFLISGWGTLKEDGPRPTHLRGVTVRRVSRWQCGNNYAKAGIPLTRSMFCARFKGKDACQGDSGGPLVRRNIQYGIVSFGIGCARPKYPGIYTHISSQAAWIRKVVRLFGGIGPRFV